MTDIDQGYTTREIDPGNGAAVTILVIAPDGSTVADYTDARKATNRVRALNRNHFGLAKR